jgi:hypothetical protein
LRDVPKVRAALTIALRSDRDRTVSTAARQALDPRRTPPPSAKP